MFMFWCVFLHSSCIHIYRYAYIFIGKIVGQMHEKGKNKKFSRTHHHHLVSLKWLNLWDWWDPPLLVCGSTTRLKAYLTNLHLAFKPKTTYEKHSTLSSIQVGI